MKQGNTIKLAAVVIWALLGLALLGLLMVGVFGQFWRPRQVEGVANTNANEVMTTTTELGTFEEIPGTGVWRAPLTLKQTYPNRGIGSYEKEAASVQNYLFFTPATNAARWLQPRHQGLILEDRVLTQPSAETAGTASALVYLLVEKDTNGDKRLSRQDAQSIAVSDAKGQHYRVLAQNVTQLNGTILVNPQQLVVLYEQVKKTMTLTVNPANPEAPPVVRELKLTPPIQSP